MMMQMITIPHHLVNPVDLLDLGREPQSPLRGKRVVDVSNGIGPLLLIVERLQTASNGPSTLQPHLQCSRSLK